MKHWLMKTEPDGFSIDDLERVGREPWTGVRNYQARNFMREMRKGDAVLFYHSSCAVPGVVGLAEVASAPYPDPTQFDPDSQYHDAKSTTEAARWDLVDVAFVRRFDPPVTLEMLRADADRLGDFALLRRGNRLSVLPVSAAQFRRILALERQHRGASR
jgi:predicted RNA-binding protein with PUA-like domain